LSECQRFQLSKVDKLSLDTTVSNFDEKARSKLFKQITIFLYLELLPTHRQKYYFVVSTHGFS